MPLDPVETLQRLVRTPSVNPMGGDVWDSHMGEGRMTDLLIEICREHGWRWTRRQVHQGRDNLLVLIEGDLKPQDGGELLLWDVHQDTVAVEGMTIDPFGGELRDGRLYGRGASDVKGSMAAMLAGLSRAAAGLSPEASRELSPGPSLRGREEKRSRPTILLACTTNEECGFTGARALAKIWSSDALSEMLQKSDFVAGELVVAALVSRRPDAAIVAEPTELNVVVAHQGVVRWRCHAFGCAAHTSLPDEGINAIYAISRVVQAIEKHHHELSASAPVHPLCGRPSACVSRIHGGVGVNTVPDHATIEIDRWLSPGEQPDAAYEKLVAYVAEHADRGRCQIVHDKPFMLSTGLNDEHNRPLAQKLCEVVRQLGRESRVIGVPYGTDAAAISASGVPTVVFGPGSIAQAHTADEYIEVSELERGAEIFHRIALQGLR